jgi:hypothetical protein
VDSREAQASPLRPGQAWVRSVAVDSLQQIRTSFSSQLVSFITKSAGTDDLLGLSLVFLLAQVDSEVEDQEE